MIGVMRSTRPALKFFGDGFIAGEAPGIVTVAGAPSARKIYVRNRRTHELVANTGSQSDGTWSVQNLDQSQKFYVIAFDHTEQFNAVIRDNVTPAPMP